MPFFILPIYIPKYPADKYAYIHKEKDTRPFKEN